MDDAQLNASASVPGKLDYSPAPGELLPPGLHTLTVTFAPADSANYTTAKATVSLLVAKAISEIQWPRPNPVSYGTKLSPLQLCAMASVQGSFEYNPGLGAVLAAGEHQLSVVFTPADTVGYAASRATASVTVAKANPRIIWPTPDPIAHGVSLSLTQLNTRASVPGSFAYRPAKGEILAPGVHELSATFTPTDTLNYTTVTSVVSLTVTEKSPTQINWPVPSAIPYGAALSAAQLNATASVPGKFVYTPSEGHVLAPGRYTLSASFTPSDAEKYDSAEASVVLEVEGSPDNASQPAAVPFGAAPFGAAPSVENAPPAAIIETPSGWTFDRINSTPADSAPAEITGEPTAPNTSPRETRTYKGAVYEKREDGKWHLQKN